MAIDPHPLPEDAQELQRRLLHTLAQLDATEERLAEKERELRRVQHWLEQLLRHRYGQKRERVDENQLFLFAAQIAARERSRRPHPRRPRLNRGPLPRDTDGSPCRSRSSGAAWCTTCRKRNATAPSARLR